MPTPKQIYLAKYHKPYAKKKTWKLNIKGKKFLLNLDLFFSYVYCFVYVCMPIRRWEESVRDPGIEVQAIM